MSSKNTFLKHHLVEMNEPKVLFSRLVFLRLVLMFQHVKRRLREE